MFIRSRKAVGLSNELVVFRNMQQAKVKVRYGYLLHVTQLVIHNSSFKQHTTSAADIGLLSIKTTRKSFDK
jgi:hypothetical protein